MTTSDFEVGNELKQLIMYLNKLGITRRCAGNNNKTNIITEVSNTKTNSTYYRIWFDKCHHIKYKAIYWCIIYDIQKYIKCFIKSD